MSEGKALWQQVFAKNQYLRQLLIRINYIDLSSKVKIEPFMNRMLAEQIRIVDFYNGYERAINEESVQN